ncbi:MAG: hypothetical protein CVV21_05605 [Candidatus Goldiibacteriota bacterium HGW-Goldbacteria-1]|jgi:hypothetical protein|nr:MAG: hypothetical protein CVV21_05605 [Candidatus Goldiibacteriota bacterium HGW-Goldbacteria-1]
MGDEKNLISKILYGIGVVFIYIIAIVLVLSSGCFVLIGLAGGEYTPMWMFVPIGLILGAGGYFIIKYIIRLSKKNNPK